MLVLAFVAAASADVSPPIGYREDCTVDRKEQAGTTCEECPQYYGSGSDSGEPTCDQQYAGTDFAYVCSTWGSSAWTEVWCDGPPREACGCVSGPGGAGWIAGIAGIALLALSRRSITPPG